MKSIKLLAVAALTSSFLFAPCFASVEAYRQQYRVPRTDIPLPEKIVHPTNLPRRYVGATVTLAMIVDEAGVPRDITILNSNDPELTQLLVPVVAQWRFTPAQKAGVAVAKRVVLPITLRDENA